ncbi:Pectinesterase inhibitor [Corchorus olitorius]|uniref:Pectinesterase inhibitor n=1 Tax=Corchorus olitorius TaxID=93759 RepID=A0A1R3K297_9ROSI|nr:Pectinesterase inhibitor [Corchorus olitorius]
MESKMNLSKFVLALMIVLIIAATLIPSISALCLDVDLACKNPEECCSLKCGPKPGVLGLVCLAV